MTCWQIVFGCERLSDHSLLQFYHNPCAQTHLFPVCCPLLGVHQYDQHESQQSGEERCRVCPWSLEHCGLLQLHQRLSVPRTPGQRLKKLIIMLILSACSNCLTVSSPIVLQNLVLTLLLPDWLRMSSILVKRLSKLGPPESMKERLWEKEE